MHPQIARIAVVLGACAVSVALTACGGADTSLPQRTISFQAPTTGALRGRAADIRRAAQLELDAINGDTSGSRLKLVNGPDPKAIAAINALALVSVGGSEQLMVNLAPPIARETDAIPSRHGHPMLSPEIWLLPPNSLAVAATRSYAASGATGADGAKPDSPLRAGTPAGRYVTAGLSADNYPPAGTKFFEKFKKQYGRAPDRYAIYGYEAVGLIVDALERLEKAGLAVTQESLAKSALAIRDRFSPVGHYDVLPSGQTTLYVFQARGKGATTGPASLIEALR
jgi:ABC-type branched-subunit amino acid transport system substrate-binding protein